MAFFCIALYTVIALLTIGYLKGKKIAIASESNNYEDRNHEKKQRSKELIPKFSNKIKSDNFTRINREKSIIAIAILAKL